MMSNKLKNFGSILFFTFLTVVLFKIFYDDYRISSNHKYCIGITKGWKRTGKGPTVYFEYTIGGEVFKSSAKSGKDTVILNDGKYFVKFLPSDPSVSRIMWDKPVPACIGGSPSDGWTKIPMCK
jgi:hypothetical protein